MTQDQAKSFLKCLGVTHFAEKGAEWLNASCPLAPYYHAKGTDSMASFGLFASPGKESHFHCFACKSGSLALLIQTLEFHTKDTGITLDFAQAREILENGDVFTMPEFQEFPEEDKPLVAWSEWWLDSLPPVDAHLPAMQYLESRNVPSHLWAQQSLRWDSNRQMIVFPFWNVWGVFAGARGRTILEGKTGIQKHYDYRWDGSSNTGTVWYNEASLTIDGPVLVVEGQFDVLRLLEIYPKVLGNLTAKPTMAKLKKLTYSSETILITDTDFTGEESWISYQKKAGILGLNLKRLVLPKEVKDPGDCHPGYLKSRLAEEFQLKGLL